MNAARSQAPAIGWLEMRKENSGTAGAAGPRRQLDVPTDRHVAVPPRVQRSHPVENMFDGRPDFPTGLPIRTANSALIRLRYGAGAEPRWALSFQRADGRRTQELDLALSQDGGQTFPRATSPGSTSRDEPPRSVKTGSPPNGLLHHLRLRIRPNKSGAGRATVTTLTLSRKSLTLGRVHAVLPAKTSGLEMSLLRCQAQAAAGHEGRGQAAVSHLPAAQWYRQRQNWPGSRLSPLDIDIMGRLPGSASCAASSREPGAGLFRRQRSRSSSAGRSAPGSDDGLCARPVCPRRQ